MFVSQSAVCVVRA